MRSRHGAVAGRRIVRAMTLVVVTAACGAANDHNAPARSASGMISTSTSAAPASTAPTLDRATGGGVGKAPGTITQGATVDKQATRVDDEPIESTGSDLTDLIRTDDPTSFVCLGQGGRGRAEFFDKRIDELTFHDNAFLYVAKFSDGSEIEIRVHPEFETAVAARHEVDRVTTPLGQLPTILRRGIVRLAILGGDPTAQADGGGEGIHIYAGNAALRESNDRLEETLFHESVHTSLDDDHGESPGWTAAQEADGKFLTTYGRENPSREDLAETALYAYGLIRHPERIHEVDRAIWLARVPTRIAYLETVFGREVFEATDEPVVCN